jgi:hypothetical protein
MKVDSPPRRLRVAGCLLAACAALLIFVATASAAVWTGESTTALSDEKQTPESTLVKSSATYDTSGSVSFTFTTAAPPLERLGVAENEIVASAVLSAPAGECSFEGALAGQPATSILSSYSTPEAVAVYGTPAAEAPATKTISGATTTLSFASGALANKGFSCAAVSLTDANPGSEGGGSLAFFPIAEIPPPLTPASSTPPASAPPAAPAPPPTKLSIARSKPLELKTGIWSTLKVKVTNPGAATSPQGSLTVKRAKGIKVKPATQTIPALTTGGSWTLSIKVQATAAAKKKTTLSLTAAASGLVATSPLVVKLK